MLNPAVLAFLALVAPWQWVATQALARLGLTLLPEYAAVVLLVGLFRCG